MALTIDQVVQALLDNPPWCPKHKIPMVLREEGSGVNSERNTEIRMDFYCLDCGILYSARASRTHEGTKVRWKSLEE